MRRNFFLIIVSFVFAAVILITYSCKHEIIYPSDYGYPGTPYVSYTPPDTIPKGKKCNPDSVYFDNEILPILTSNCTMCHNSNSGGEENFDLRSWTGVMNSGIVRPGKPSSSKFYKVITAPGGEDLMPRAPYSRLSQAQVDLIYKWIAQGAKYLTCNACNPKDSSFKSAIKPFIDNNCVGCHKSGKIILTDYTNIKNNIEKIICSISYTNGYLKMPQGAPKVSDCVITQFTKWKNDGAKDN